MYSKKTLKILITFINILEIILFLVIISFLLMSFFIPSNSHTYLYNNYEAGLPVRIEIPNIKVKAIINYVGLTSNGEMDVPKGPSDTVWYKLGTRPGNIGSAVIAGHYGSWKDGGSSVFDNLDKLVKGDKVYIEDENGMIITFIVKESRKYDPEADASNVFNLNDGVSHLNLVTCEGTWDNNKKTYSNRLVVFTDKE